MIFQLLAATSFLLWAYDAWLSQDRMKKYGNGFELTASIKFLSTYLGPELAVILGIMGPAVGWIYIFKIFNLTWALALMTGFGIKRFEVQLTSRVFEKQAAALRQMINDLGSDTSTLHAGESTPKSEPSNSKDDNGNN